MQVDLRLLCSLFHYSFARDQRLFIFIFILFLTLLHIQQQQPIKGEKNNLKKKKKMSFLIGKPKSFFLIYPINLQISQKLDHFSKNLLLIIINFVSFSMILNNSEYYKLKSKYYFFFFAYYNPIRKINEDIRNQKQIVAKGINHLLFHWRKAS